MTTDQAIAWLREHAPCTVFYGPEAVLVRCGEGVPSATAKTLEEAVGKCRDQSTRWCDVPLDAYDDMTVSFVAEFGHPLVDPPLAVETWRDRGPLL
jgi:hypothetical protein